MFGRPMFIRSCRRLDLSVNGKDREIDDRGAMRPRVARVQSHDVSRFPPRYLAGEI
jgi:hypothetical protein